MFCHLRRRPTQRSAATPILPSGYRRRQPIYCVRAPRRWPNIESVALPCSWTNGVCNATHNITRTGCFSIGSSTMAEHRERRPALQLFAW